MPHLIQTDLRNRLLLRLPADSFEALRPWLQPTVLPRGAILIRPNEVITDVYFPESGIVSMMMAASGGQEVETGMVGRDGLGPIAGILGGERVPIKAVMQIAGTGFRVTTDAIAKLLDDDRRLRALLLRYVFAFSIQVACTALFNATAGIEQRLARWLLMCHDRVDGDEIGLTHEFLAVMLAVRRASVTVAMHALEANGLVEARRGAVVIRDRTALERLADAAYGQPETDYRRLIGEFA